MKLIKPNIKSGTYTALLLHTAAAAAVFILLLSIYLYGILPRITDHGKIVTVPDLSGTTVEELKTLLESNNLRYSINDSSYSEDFPPLTVIHQYPTANTQVKKKRCIYVTLNQRNPPLAYLPDLVDQSQINGESMLRNNGFRVGQIILVAGPFSGLIREARHKGQVIQAGTRLAKGSSIDLVVIDGQMSPVFALEDLTGLPYREAVSKLRDWSLIVGKVSLEAKADTLKGFVKKQNPEAGETINVGDRVDLWIGNPE